MRPKTTTTALSMQYSALMGDRFDEKIDAGKATDSRFVWHGTASARCALAFSVRLLDQRSNARSLGVIDCTELNVAQLCASALQQALRIHQARALEKAEVDPRAEGHNVGVAINHLSRSATVRSRLLAKADHFAGVWMDLEDESPDTLHYGPQRFAGKLKKVAELADLGFRHLGSGSNGRTLRTCLSPYNHPGSPKRIGAAFERPAFVGAPGLDQWRLGGRPPRPSKCARCDTTRGFTNLLCTFPQRGSLWGVSRAALVAIHQTGPS